MKPAVITSDLHLGSPFCDTSAFRAFLESLPGNVTLVLNGDLMDPWRPLPPDHVATLSRLLEEADRREVVWIRGNNDHDSTVSDFGRIRIEPAGMNGGAVCVTHGHEFDRLLHHNPVLTFPFKTMYRLRSLLGAPPMHIGAYAKRWGWLYRALLAHIVARAVRFAEGKGCHTIVCGHTHFADDRRVRGVRYVNTGSWTERPYCYARVDGDEVVLKSFDGGAGNGK